jgi:hypothetical protein
MSFLTAWIRSSPNSIIGIIIRVTAEFRDLCTPQAVDIA